MTGDNSDIFPVVLTIASSDNSAGAGVQMDLYAFSMLKVHGCSIITGITAQNSYEYVGFGPVSGELIEAQLESLVSDFTITAVKTGMLTKPDIVAQVAGLLNKFKLTAGLVVDPVLGTTIAGDLEFKEELAKALRDELLPRARVITPNLPEAYSLLDKAPESAYHEKPEQLLEKLKSLGSPNVLLKGGHIMDAGKRCVTDLLIDDAGNLHRFEAELVESGPVHGTGCLLSALITAHLGLGFDVYQSVAGAESLLHECLKHTQLLGNGNLRYFNSGGCGGWQMHQARVYNALQTVKTEFIQLLKPELVPEVGINFGYALPAAITTDDICALDARIIKTGSGIRSTGGIAFGASSHVARIILAAMSADLRYRSAANIRYSADLVTAAKNAGLTIGTFARADEPEDASTMEWGTRYAIDQLGGVPDMIYDLGGVGKEPMIRLLGKEPGDVVGKLRMLEINLK